MCRLGIATLDITGPPPLNIGSYLQLKTFFFFAGGDKRDLAGGSGHELAVNLLVEMAGSLPAAMDRTLLAEMAGSLP